MAKLSVSGGLPLLLAAFFGTLSVGNDMERTVKGIVYDSRSN
jgi:hypothetical protein